ncbi:efflux RND transporter periplasmic adaptor subunit [Pseudacidovorax intermedius]|uniref:efflux RND transporter periplasmic adaptor subunit n=1 Tax=Pseudacidovorax intermedius TaxID=433924 RepID=UPI0026EB18B1|nr:efflux RND transporter periplasmic adaptor subunit [Pseudacidovorax intermedius]
MGAADPPHTLGAPDALGLVQALQALRRRSSGEPGFWDEYAAGLRHLCRARRVWIAGRVDAAADSVLADGSGWQLLGGAAEAALPVAGVIDAATLASLQALAPRATDKGFALMPVTHEGVALFHLAVRQAGERPVLALIEIPQRERASLNELALRAQLVADMPGVGAPPGVAVEEGVPAASPTLPALLALATEVQREAHGSAARLALVNGLAALCGASHVALGWVDEGRAQLAAISHLDRFDAGTDLVALVEAAMDESLAHEGVLQAEQAPVLQRLGEALGLPAVCAMAIGPEDGPPEAVLLFALPEGRGVDEPGLARVRGMAALVLPRLAELRQRERWWGLRARDALRLRLASWLGPRHVWPKAVAVAAGLFVLYAAFATWDYRVHGTGQLATDSTRVLAAGYDGRVDSAETSAGERVQSGQLLATLDTRELRQQENDADAEVRRFGAEADKARAAAAWAEMEVATARQRQAQARLARVREALAQAEVRAPFDGVIVEGERKDLLGAPVKKGDKLFRIARVEGLYVVATVPEGDMPLVPAQASGELVLVSDPDRRIPLRVTAVIPVAQTKGQDGNQFLLRAEMQQPAADWWRPGMSGAVRIDAGERNVAWILTHRLVDKLRLWLWW